MAPSVQAISHPPAVISAHVSAAQPLVWLENGWRDFRDNPGPSIVQGILLVGMGWLILLFCSAKPGLLAAAVSGFLLVGPVFAAGFYELSRLRAAGGKPTLDQAIQGAAGNLGSLAGLGLVLAVLTVAWAWLSSMLFERAVGPGMASPQYSSYQTVVDWNIGTSFLLTYLLTGVVLAVLAFVLSAVAAPMLFERRVSTADAMFASVKVALANPAAMVVWALLIAALTALGFATMLLGLIVILPVLGHATWHAYRDLVGGDARDSVQARQGPGAGFWDVH